MSGLDSSDAGELTSTLKEIMQGGDGELYSSYRLLLIVLFCFFSFNSILL